MSDDHRELRLFRSPPHACSYLPGEIASSAVVDPGAPLDPATYGALLSLGFRRSGRHVYRPHCPACHACVPARIPVPAFRPRRSQRRTWRANAAIQVRSAAPQLSEEQFALYRTYTAQRHEDGEMANMTAAACQAFLATAWCSTEFLEFRLHGRLVAVAATDRVPDGLSAVYTFFDPALSSRSLGTHAILEQIGRARERGLEYLYLGYWIGASRKMRYKADYRPLELLLDGRWQRFATHQRLPGDRQPAQRI